MLNQTTADIQSTGAASSGAPSSLEGDFGNITIAYYKDVLCVVNKFKMENIILTSQDHVELLNVGAIPVVGWIKKASQSSLTLSYRLAINQSHRRLVQ